MLLRRSAVSQGLVATLTLMPAVPLRTVAEDRCLIETTVTGAYINPCMIDSTRAFAWPSVGTVSIAQGSVGPGTTGAAVWTAGTALASYLALDPDGSTAIRGKRVVELGCGTGLCGIVAARLGASQVLLTDGNPDLLDRTRANVRRNLDSSDRAAVEVRALTWSELVDTPLQQGFDVVLASDVLYQSAAWRPLATCVRELLRPKEGTLLLAEAGHEATPAESSVAGFQACAEGAGLRFDGVERLGYGETLLVRAGRGSEGCGC